jgi:nicotinamidase-related amidase
MTATKHSEDDLHGNVPDSAAAALLLVDVINDLDFPENGALLRKADELARSIARLKARCQSARIPCIYVNDNSGKWRSDSANLLKDCLSKKSPGRNFVRRLLPTKNDYIVLKPKHSAFFATPLETILAYMKVHSVILAGVTTDSCILGTAMELHVRDFKIFVPSDCTYALSERDHQRALQIIESSFAAETFPAKNLSFKNRRIKRSSGKVAA